MNPSNIKFRLSSFPKYICNINTYTVVLWRIHESITNDIYMDQQTSLKYIMIFPKLSIKQTFGKNHGVKSK